jgi:hypothetical protein
MYVIIGSHFVTLEGKFLLIALVIVRITLKHFDNVIFSSAKTLSKCSKDWQQFFERCTHRCLAFRGIWRTVTFNVILTITNAISKNLPSSGTKWLPIMTYIHPPVTLDPKCSWDTYLFLQVSNIHSVSMKIKRFSNLCINLMQYFFLCKLFV